MMSTDLDEATKRLWLSYKAYHIVSCRNGTDSSEYATACTNGYLEYLNTMITECYEKWNMVEAIENQIRILRGFIECYDRPVIKDKVVHKTRGSV